MIVVCFTSQSVVVVISGRRFHCSGLLLYLCTDNNSHVIGSIKHFTVIHCRLFENSVDVYSVADNKRATKLTTHV